MKLIDKLAKERINFRTMPSPTDISAIKQYCRDEYKAGMEKMREMAVTELTQLIIERNGRIALQEIQETLSGLANEEVEDGK